MSTSVVIRQLLRELRMATPQSHPVRHTPMYEHIMEQSRKYQVTDKKICKAHNEMKFRAETYLCYLNSLRRYKELQQQYHGKGERGIEETAKLVGLKLPKLYTDSNEKH